MFLFNLLVVNPARMIGLVHNLVTRRRIYAFGNLRDFVFVRQSRKLSFTVDKASHNNQYAH